MSRDGYTLCHPAVEIDLKPMIISPGELDKNRMSTKALDFSCLNAVLKCLNDGYGEHIDAICKVKIEQLLFAFSISSNSNIQIAQTAKGTKIPHN